MTTTPVTIPASAYASLESGAFRASILTRGEWICLDARTHLGSNGCGLAESTLDDIHGPIGKATQSLSVRTLP